MNSFNEAPRLEEYKVVAAYPQGSLHVESPVEQIPGYTEEVKKMGVKIIDGIPSLLKKVGVILLEINDGSAIWNRIPVLKAGNTILQSVLPPIQVEADNRPV